jgi:hypothetical protein
LPSRTESRYLRRTHIILPTVQWPRQNPGLAAPYPNEHCIFSRKCEPCREGQPRRSYRYWVSVSKGLRLDPAHSTTPAPRPRVVSHPVWAGDESSTRGF